MRRASAPCLLLALVGAASTADVHLPKPPPPIPLPMPSAAAYALDAGDLLFVGCDQPTLVRVSPEGLLDVTEVEAGTHHWKFNGVRKTYKTTTPHTYSFEAVGKGEAVVEFFWSEKDKVQTRKMVIACNAARPPPPPDEDKKKKDDKPEPQASRAWVIVVEDEKAPRTLETAMFLFDPWWDTLRPKHEYRHYMSNYAVAVEKGYTAEAQTVGFPACLIIDAKDGQVLRKFKAASVEQLKKAFGEVVKP